MTNGLSSFLQNPGCILDLIFRSVEKNLVSKLWVSLTVNYIFCDVFSLYDSVFLNELLNGNVGGIEFRHYPEKCVSYKSRVWLN
ncbi:DUF6326 family protein [Tamlana crocina]